jgi:hypothetical protein
VGKLSEPQGKLIARLAGEEVSSERVSETPDSAWRAIAEKNIREGLRSCHCDWSDPTTVEQPFDQARPKIQ